MSEQYENKTFVIFSPEEPNVPYIQIAADKYLISAGDMDEIEYPHVEVPIPSFDGFFSVTGIVTADNLMKVYGYIQMWKRVTTTREGLLISGLCTNKEALQFFERYTILEGIEI